MSKDIIDDKPDGFGWLALRLWQLGHEGMQHGERLFTRIGAIVRSRVSVHVRCLVPHRSGPLVSKIVHIDL